MSHHRWELFPMGNIPHEVLAILLGSLPKVPDPKQEVEALERQYATHDDRLSDDDDEEDEVQETRTDTTLPVQEPRSQQQHERAGQPKDSRSAKSSQQQANNDDDDDDDAQRSWNVPDEEWEWSDEEPSTLNNSKPARTGKQGGSLAVPSRTQQQQRNSRSGLGISDSVVGRRLSTGPARPGGSSSSTATSSCSSSPNVTPQTHRNDSSTVPVAAAVSSHPLSVAQDLCVSVCDSGRYIACASKKMFAILQRQAPRSCASTLPVQDRRPGQGQGSPQEAQEWVLIGQGSGVENTLRDHHNTVFAALCAKITSKAGQLVVIQQLHHTPVVSIKARVGSGKVPGEDEDEMTILHEGGKVVCIEGESLWVVLRLSSGSGQSKAVQAAQAPTFAYKKWSLQNQDLLVDIVSCGPARHKPTLSNGFSSSSSSSMYTSQATERFVSVGSKPMMAFYASCSSSRPMFSATSLATQMAARVTSAVFGFAKSIWGSSPSPRSGSPAFGSPDTKRLSGQQQQQQQQSIQDGGTAGPYGTVYPSAMAPATEVPAVLWLSDSQRCIRHVSLAPLPPRGACYHYPSKLAAMTDSLGRVLLVDLEECEIIRMWKGLRGARCGWLQEERLVRIGQGSGSGSGSGSGPGSDSEKRAPMVKRLLILYLVIYAPKRGTIEIYPARQGKRVGLVQVGLGWKICTTFTSPIGKPVVLDRMAGSPSMVGFTSGGGDGVASPALSASSSASNTTTTQQQHASLAQCLMIGPTGEVKRVASRLADSSNGASPLTPNSLVASPALSSSSSSSPSTVVAESIASRLQNVRSS
ncbi:Rab3 GTPase-activating protein non-catalytic subunit [Mortierella alpina]|nr:Rab3 GTPase-activating protein non-catalytic subunit [Mortierella alpina]